MEIECMAQGNAGKDALVRLKIDIAEGDKVVVERQDDGRRMTGRIEGTDLVECRGGLGLTAGGASVLRQKIEAVVKDAVKQRMRVEMEAQIREEIMEEERMREEIRAKLRADGGGGQ